LLARVSSSLIVGQKDRQPTERWTPPFVKEEAPCPNACLGENINFDHRSWWDIKPRNQVLTCADDLNLLRDKMSTINKNTEAVILARKEAGFEVSTEEMKYILISCY
jgi:hypothetical protein